MSNEPKPRPPQNQDPEIQPPSGSPEKKFPAEPTPMAGGKKTAESHSDDTESHDRLGSGEDSRVESGEDASDPEQQAAGGDDTEKSFE